MPYCYKHGDIYVSLAVFLSTFFFQSQDPDEQQTQKEQKNSYTNLRSTADLGIFCLTLTSHIVSKECGIGPSRILLTCISTQFSIREHRLYSSLHPIIFIAVLTQCTSFDLAGCGRFRTSQSFSIWWYSLKELDGTWASAQLCTVVILQKCSLCSRLYLTQSTWVVQVSCLCRCQGT